MSVTLAGTYINALMNISLRLSDMVEQHGEDANIEKLKFQGREEYVGKNMNVYSMKCYLLKSLNLV